VDVIESDEIRDLRAAVGAIAAPFAILLLLVDRTGRTAEGVAQLPLFLVPAAAPGLSAAPLPADVMLAARQFTLHLDDVRLPASALVGDEGARCALRPGPAGVGHDAAVLGARAAPAHRPGEPGDDPQLRRPAQPGPATVLPGRGRP